EAKNRLCCFPTDTGIGVRFGVRCGPCDSKIPAAHAVRIGGGGRNRTDECSFCRAVPYHLATPPLDARSIIKFSPRARGSFALTSRDRVRGDCAKARSA